MHTTFCFHGQKCPVVVTTTVLAFPFSEFKRLLTRLLVLLLKFFVHYRYILLFTALRLLVF